MKRHILCLITLFENRAVYERILKNLMQPDRTQMAIKYGACALNAG